LLVGIHCPLGMSIGGNDPAEIAVSISAQLLQIRDSRTSSPELVSEI
jgi:xanthine dehydrogenase accessory factor